MTDLRLIIGVDSCVLIESIHLRGRFPGYPSVRLFVYLEARVFKLLLLEDVEAEVRRVLQQFGEEVQLDQILSRCDVVHCPCAAPELVASEGLSILPYLRHENDVPIAVALKHCPIKPVIFLSSNKKHWKPSLRDLVGGIEITTAKEFLKQLEL